ncbi:hypothetical protein BC829DRAFT_421986 [Chytridium lagenaria]|nr:hypothetical protein BC829DRAFT_421986 [Chytridium lagenaria]
MVRKALKAKYSFKETLEKMQASLASTAVPAAAVAQQKLASPDKQRLSSSSSSTGPGPVFEDEGVILGVFVVMAISLVVALTSSLILEHVNTLKNEGKFISTVEVIESWTGWNLNWLLNIYEIPIPKRRLSKPKISTTQTAEPEKTTDEAANTAKASSPSTTTATAATAAASAAAASTKGPESPGTTSGHPKPGFSAFGGPTRVTIPGPTSLYPRAVLSQPTSPTTDVPKPERRRSLGSPLSTLSDVLPVPQSAQNAITAAHKAVTHIIPTFPIKHRTLYATRDDPFHPELAITPQPIAATLDVVDLAWEGAVNTVAWGVGVAFVRPMWMTQKVVKKTVG